MSTETSVELFWGFPIQRMEHTTAVDLHRDPIIRVGSVGDDSDLTSYVSIAASWCSVPIGRLKRIDTYGLGIPIAWRVKLSAFCQKHGIAWPDDGPDWYVGALRL